MNSRIERESPSFDEWTEVLEAKAREHTHKERQAAILIEWSALVFFVLVIVISAILASGK